MPTRRRVRLNCNYQFQMKLRLRNNASRAVIVEVGSSSSHQSTVGANKLFTRETSWRDVKQIFFLFQEEEDKNDELKSRVNVAINLLHEVYDR